LFSSERQINSILALGVLHVERLAFPVLVKSDPSISHEWIPFTESDIERARKTIANLPVFLGFLAPTAVRERMLSDGKVLGLCGAMFDMAALAYETPLFEEEYKPMIEAQLAKAQSCRLSMLKRLMARQDLSRHESMIDRVSVQFGIPRVLVGLAFFVPSYRQTVGRLITVITSPVTSLSADRTSEGAHRSP
jgi:hypothetical protein